MPTATTVPLLLLVLVLWRVTKGELLSIVLFLSIFQAASGLNLGTLGFAPWILTLVVGLLIKSVKSQTAPFTTPNINTIAVRLLLAFVCYAIFSGLIYPLLFRGVLVQGSHDSTPGPLVLGIANVAQICYLLLAVAVFGLALSSSRKALSSALDWYVRGCVVACVFAMYQLANAVTGVPYPAAILYSNPRYVIYQAYMIDGMWRLNSTFTEASSLAGYLSVGVALLGWDVMTRPLRWRSILSLTLMVITLLLTLSSAGYLSMIVIVLAGCILSLRALFRAQSLSRAKAILLLSVASLVTVALITTKAAATINKAIHSVLLDKEETSSYRERTASNYAAMETARQTYYMGAGWGSVRCSSLGPGLLGTVGIVGTLLFCTFLLSLTLPLFGTGPISRLGDNYEKSLLGTLVILAAMMVASNEPDQPILWVLFAACAAGPNKYRVLRRGIAGYRASVALHRPARSL
jgi:flagellar biosynthesis protein FliQ